jgi:hypothetical protein
VIVSIVAPIAPIVGYCMVTIRLQISADDATTILDSSRACGRRGFSRVVSLVTLLVLQSHVAHVMASTHSNEESGIAVIVGLVPSTITPLEDYGTIDRILVKAEAYAMTIPDEPMLDRLRNHPGVEYVSYDGVTFPMTMGEELVDLGMTMEKEQVGWGIPYIQAISDLIPAPASAAEQTDGSCFRMCIVDGGLFAAHPDLVSRSTIDTSQIPTIDE